MALTLITNIRLLAGVRDTNALLRGPDLALLNCLEDAYVLIEDGIIARYGPMDELEDAEAITRSIINASDQVVLPAWCDSHTHLVYAGSREEEFVDKIRGATYAEIAAKGGGILNSARKLAATSELELLQSAWWRLQEIMQQGTGAVEIKSGYGLSVESELKILRVIKRIRDSSPIPVKATFLGAHTYPIGFEEDHDYSGEGGFRVVQLTPPGSACSVAIGTGIIDTPPGSVKGLHLVVSDISAARTEFTERGVDISEVQDLGGILYAHFRDPDGNGWTLQQISS